MSSLRKRPSARLSLKNDDQGTFFALVRMDTLTHALSGALLARATAARDAPAYSMPRRLRGPAPLARTGGRGVLRARRLRRVPIRAEAARARFRRALRACARTARCGRLRRAAAGVAVQLDRVRERRGIAALRAHQPG